MTKWSDWQEWTRSPLGVASKGALLGALVGAAYDEIKDRKAKGRRMALGALLGLLGYTGLHQYMEPDGKTLRALAEARVRDAKARNAESGGSGK